MGKAQVLVLFTFVLLGIASVYGALEPAIKSEELVVVSKVNRTPTDANSAQLTSSGNHSVTRFIGRGPICSKNGIEVHQGPDGKLPSGIPTYLVEISNGCSSCSISEIHMSCGPFSSARLVNPMLFRRIKIGDCLVNNGQPLEPGRTISFQYANTFMFPLSVTSVVAC